MIQQIEIYNFIGKMVIKKNYFENNIKNIIINIILKFFLNENKT